MRQNGYRATAPEVIFGALLVTIFAAISSSPAGAAEYTLDIGGPFDGLFLGDGWEPHEGPYTQYGEIWKSRGRWARQGAVARIPVFPGVINQLSIRTWFGEAEGQRLRLTLNGRKPAELAPNKSLLYDVEIAPDYLDNKSWAELRIETNQVAPRGPGDFRDLRAAVDWIKVSGDAPARDYLREILDEKGVLAGVQPDRAPAAWRFRCDPNNVGNRHRPADWSCWDHPGYDDSGFELVPADHTPPLRRGDAAWYRAWLITQNPKTLAGKLRLPGRGFERSGIREVWVNGVKLNGDGLDAAAGKALLRGPNLIVVKLLKGPFPKAAGDALAEQPVFSGRWADGRVLFSVAELKPLAAAGSITARLVSPSGGAVADIKPGAEVELTEYGEHALIVEDRQQRRQVFPVHFLGIHFFHWGWYSAGEGTDWRGFTAQSNDYVDQLFSRLDDWGTPHHSISYGGAIFTPGTGFHVPKKVDYPKLFREAIASGRLGFIGMPFPPRNICTDFGESLVRSVRKSVEVYESVLGYRPTSFMSHDSTLTPLLPQIMRILGYDTYCTSDNWWGNMSVPNSRDCFWRSEDGSRIRVLDSPFHGISVAEAAARAIEQGKPAVLCHEEFACLDSTGFLHEAEWNALAKRGIFLKPVSLEEYRRITERFAAAMAYTGDAGLGYKGWTGGSEGETEFEKSNRILESQLVALENMATLARTLGITVEQGPIDEKWDLSMRFHECHCHWGNGFPTMTQKFTEWSEWCRSEMARLGKLIAERFSPGEGVTVFNPVGFRRGGLVSVKLPEGTRSLEPVSGKGRRCPVQPDPGRPGFCLAWMPDLPSIGCRGYRTTNREPDRNLTAGARIENGCAVLENNLVRIRVAANGEIASVEDIGSGRSLLQGANRLYFARRHGLAPEEPLSRFGNPLNLRHYAQPAGKSAPRIVCNGPALASAECDLLVRDYPRLRITLTIALAAGERLARMRLKLNFLEPAAVCPRGAPDPHEGTYLPGIFSAFAMPIQAKPRADMAYCLTDDVVAATNHETFLRVPFRNGTFNALSLAGPDTGQYAVLTRGLNDFFVVREPEPYLALSFGMGTPGFPYKGEYVHEYALMAPAPGVEAYKAAQGFLVDPVAVTGAAGSDVSLVESSARGSIVAGVEHRQNEVLARVVNLDRRGTVTKLRGLLNLDGAEIRPEGERVENRCLNLKPRSVREISKVRQTREAQ